MSEEKPHIFDGTGDVREWLSQCDRYFANRIKEDKKVLHATAWFIDFETYKWWHPIRDGYLNATWETFKNACIQEFAPNEKKSVESRIRKESKMRTMITNKIRRVRRSSKRVERTLTSMGQATKAPVRLRETKGLRPNQETRRSVTHQNRSHKFAFLKVRVTVEPPPPPPPPKPPGLSSFKKGAKSEKGCTTEQKKKQKGMSKSQPPPPSKPPDRSIRKGEQEEGTDPPRPPPKPPDRNNSMAARTPATTTGSPLTTIEGLLTKMGPLLDQTAVSLLLIREY